MAAPKHTVVLPVFNEKEALPFVLDKLIKSLDEDFEILVVDDGSSDGSGEIARKFGVRVLTHPRNLGKGAAMRTGVKAATGQNVIFVDADDTYPVEAIRVIGAELENGYDFVLGVRTNKLNIHPINRLGNFIFAKLVNIIYRTDIRDPLSGMYGMKKDAFLSLEITSTGFDIETEIVIKIASRKLAVKQIAIPYHERKGDTKLDPFKDGLRILRRILTFVFIFNPTYGFVLPGAFMFFLAAVALGFLASGPIQLAGVRLDIHSLIYSAMASIIGLQLITFGLIVKIYGVLYKGLPVSPLLKRFIDIRVWIYTALIAVGLIALGGYLVFDIAAGWISHGFSPIMELKESIISFSVLVIGIQLLFSSFVVSVFAKDYVNKKSLAKLDGYLQAST